MKAGIAGQTVGDIWIRACGTVCVCVRARCSGCSSPAEVVETSLNWCFSAAAGQRAGHLEVGIAPALRPSKDIGPSLKLSEGLQNLLVSPAARELFLHSP